MLCPALGDFGHSMVKPRRGRLRSGLSGLARGSTVDGAVHRHVTQGESMTVVLDAVLSNQAGIILVLDGHSLKIEDVAAAARQRQPIQLHPDAVARIDKCRGLLERKIRAGEIMYGVNTGIGELAEVVLTPEQVGKFQRYLLYSHAAGCGEPCSEEDVRAGMLARLNT